jgi:hypothetical protein
VIGAPLDVRAPRYVVVWIDVTVRVAERAEQPARENVRRAAERALYAFLNPYTGGPDNTGWPIGRDLHVSEIYARLQRVAGVQYVEDVNVRTSDPNSPGTLISVSPRLLTPFDGVLCSGEHQVRVQ